MIGDEARKVFDEAQKLLRSIISAGLLEARAVVGFYPARSSGDDILLYRAEEDDPEPTWTLHGLRQQADCAQENFLCLSDFVASGGDDGRMADYVGMFAVSAGFGCKELCAQ